MMEEQSRKSSKKRPVAVKKTDAWWVRNDLSTQYGPVDFETVRLWVREGRISPSGEISPDGKTWSAADSDSSLEMDWLIVFPDGHFYGPVHIDVLNELKKGEVWIPGTVSFKRADSQRPQNDLLQKRLGELQRNAVVQRRQFQKELKALKDAHKKELAKQKTALQKEATKQLEALQTKAEKETKGTSTRTKKLKTTQHLTQETAADKKKAEAELQEQGDQLELLRQENAEMGKALQKMEKQKKSSERKCVTAQDQKDALAGRLKESEQNAQTLQKKVDSQAGQISSLNDQAVSLQQENKALQSRIREVESLLAQEQSDKKELQRQIDMLLQQKEEQEADWADAARQWKEYEVTTTAEIQKLESQVRDLDTTLETERNDFALSKQSADEMLRLEQENFTLQRQKLEIQISQAKNENAKARLALQKSQEQGKALAKVFESLQNERNQLIGQVGRLKSNLVQAQEKLDAKVREIGELTDLVHTLEQTKRAVEIRLEKTEAELIEERTFREQDEKESATYSKQSKESLHEGGKDAGGPIILDAEILSVETSDQEEEEKPSGQEKKANVFEVGEKFFSKMKRSAAEAFHKYDKPGGTQSPFLEKDKNSLEALEQQLQWELSNLGKKTNEFFK